jgi:predicted RNase H-like HicB family nuclease
METMSLTITLVQDEDGMYVAECPAIPGCVSQGRTPDEAERNIRDAIRECLAVRRSQGLPLTIEVRQLEVSV